MKPSSEWTAGWKPRAAREAARALAWWAANRPLAPDLLEREIVEAIELLEICPTAGAPSDVPRIRGLVLQRTRYLLFYSLDFHSRRIEILCLWSSLRGRAPKLRGV